MKKALSIILSFAVLVTSLVCMFTSSFAASAAVGYSEDFESYTVGTDMAADDALEWKVYDEGENGYFKGKPGSNGWMTNGKSKTALVSNTKASATGGKSMAVPSWAEVYKEVAVKEGNIYTLTFKYNADAVEWRNFGVYDVSNVTADGYSLKAYTSWEPKNAANAIQLYDKTLLKTLAWERNKSFTANVWNTYTATFTVEEGTTKILLAFCYEGSGAMYIDDISLTYVEDTEAKAIFKDGSFEIAPAVAVGTTVAGSNGVRATEYKNNKPSINANGWVGSHYGNGNVLLGNTTYSTSTGSFTTPAAKDGTHIMRLTTEWHTIAKVVNVKANTNYELSYWYYADKADAKFMDGMDYAIGLNANATTITIPVTKYEADGVTIKDCGGDILADGTDGQTRINYTPKDGDNKNAVGVWTKRTLYFNSGSFTKIAIPFYHKKNNVYIDNVKIDEYVDLKVNVVIEGADDKNAGVASVKLNDEGTELTYTAKAFSNAVFKGWYDGSNLVETAATFTKAYDSSSYKVLTAKFECLFKNEFANGYFDDLATGLNVVEGQTINKLAEGQINGSWKYTFATTPSSSFWMTQQGAYSNVPVVVKATDDDAYNKALEIKQWANLGRVVTVKPNHKYQLTFNYYLPTGCEWGNFNIYNVSNYNGTSYLGMDSLTGATTNENIWLDVDKNKFPSIHYYRSSAKADSVDKDGNTVDSHDVWKTFTFEFETDNDDTKILIAWSPEGNQPFYLDDVVLSSVVIPKVNVVITGEDTTNAGGAYAKLSDDQKKITYVATTYPNGEFLGWFRDGQLVTKELTFTEDFDNNNYKQVEARFNCTYKNYFSGDAGFESTSVGTNVLKGGTTVDKGDLKYVIINGYDKATEGADSNAAADVAKIKQAGINAAVKDVTRNGVKYAAVVVNPSDATTMANAKAAIGNPTSPITTNLYLYTYIATANEDNWINHLTASATVVEKANDKSEINHALKVPIWGKVGKILDVEPNTDYNFTFEYWQALYLEFGSVVIYDISGYDGNELISRDDFAGNINTDNKFKLPNGDKLKILASWRSAGKGGAENPEIHDQWCSLTLTFAASLKTNRVLVVFAPEGNTTPNATYSDGSPKPVASDKNLYLDNLVLAGAELDYPITPKAAAGQEEMGGVYPDTGYIPVGKSEATLTFMASPTAGNKFVKWQLDGVDVAGEAGTNPVYTGTFNKKTKLTPVFEKIGEGNLVVEPGAETFTDGQDILDNSNTPSVPGSWFAVWSTDGSDGNGYSAKYLEVDDNGNPRGPQKFWLKVSATNETSRSGNMAVKFESMTYQTMGRDITGLQKNKRYLLSFWVKFTSESSYMNYVTIIPKADKDALWQNGECDSSPLNTHGAGGKSISHISLSEGNLKLDGKVSGWQKISIAFNTGDNDAVTLAIQMIDPKSKAPALYLDDIGVEEISASTKLVNATANYSKGGVAQTSAGNGMVKPGELTMFYAVPNKGLEFKAWYDMNKVNVLNESRYHIVNLNQDTTYYAQFRVINVELVSYELGGFATVDKSGVFPAGTEVTFTATPNEGNVFTGWYDVSNNKLVSTDLVYKATHNADVSLVAKFEGYNKPAREVLGLNGFENYPIDTQLKETWLKSIIDYQIYADGSNDNSWTKFLVTNKRVYEGDKAMLCVNRWRFTRLEFKGLNKNTTYKISFKYQMNEFDEAARMYTYIGPTGVEAPSEANNKGLMYFYDETSLGGGRGWDTYELYFNSGELTTLEFGIKFEAATPPYSNNNAYLNPWGSDQSQMYIDNLELWEYETNDTIIGADFEDKTSAWLSVGNKTTFDNGVANIPGNSAINQYVKVSPFTQYLLTFEAKAGALEAGAIGLEFNGVNALSSISSISSTSVSNTAMNKYTIAFTTGNEEAINIAFSNLGLETALVDNVALTVDTTGYSEGVIEKVDFESERFAINNYLIVDPNKEDILKNPNEPPFQNEGFVIYSATSENDNNVLNGNKSLKILPQDDNEVQHKLWQTWMNFPAAKINGNYLITFNYRFENPNGGAFYLAGDAKDVYAQEHTIIAQDDKWHSASFSIDNTSGLIFIKAALGTIAGNAGSAIYVDDIVYQLHPAMITEATTRYSYCENLYNAVPNNDFEDAITDADWKGMPASYKVMTGSAFTEDKFLRAGVASTTYTKVIEVAPSAAYYVGVSLRGAKGTKGTFNLMATNLSGSNVLFTDVEQTAKSTITYNGSGDWERYGMKFVTPSNGKISIVIDTRNGAIDVDNIMIFPIKFKYTYDPNDYYDYKPYDYTDMSNVIINGGVGKQPYYDGNLNVGRDKDPYEANEATTTLMYNPTHSTNNVINVIALLISIALGLLVVGYLIVKSKKEEVK